MSIVNLLRDLQDEFGVSVIYITHDLATAYYISDRLVIMQKGFVVEMGPARPILDAPEHPYSRLLKESVLSVTTPGPMDWCRRTDRRPRRPWSGRRRDTSGTRGRPLRQGVRRTIVHETGRQRNIDHAVDVRWWQRHRAGHAVGLGAVLLAWRSASASWRHSTAAT